MEQPRCVTEYYITPSLHTHGARHSHTRRTASTRLLARSLALQEGPVTHTSGPGWLWEAPQNEKLGSTRTPGYSSLHQPGAPQGCMPDTRCLPGGSAPSVVSTCLTLSPPDHRHTSIHTATSGRIQTSVRTQPYRSGTKSYPPLNYPLPEPWGHPKPGLPTRPSYL